MPVISQARCPRLKDSLTRHPVSVVSKKGSLTHFSSMYRFTCIFSASSRPIASASSSSCRQGARLRIPLQSQGAVDVETGLDQTSSQGGHKEGQFQCLFQAHACRVHLLECFSEQGISSILAAC